MPDSVKINKINNLLKKMTVQERLVWISQNYKKPAYTTSLQREGQYLIWSIFSSNISLLILTLQTGKLFPETLSLLNITEERYGIKIKQIEPDPVEINSYINSHGEYGFYESIENRKKCCKIRKVNPLKKELLDCDAWITGLSREQSNLRQNTPLANWDKTNGIMKFNPLADISKQEIEKAIVEHEIPVSPLYERGYSSIGCEPCTRATKQGEHARAGRWWWEQNSASECGLHNINVM